MAGLEGLLGSRASTGFCMMLTPPRALMDRCTVLAATGQNNPDYQIAKRLRGRTEKRVGSGPGVVRLRSLVEVQQAIGIDREVMIGWDKVGVAREALGPA